MATSFETSTGSSRHSDDAEQQALGGDHVSKHQQLLFAFLKQHALPEKSFTLDEVIHATGYMPSTFKTHYSKHLKGLWISPVDDSHYRVHDFSAVTYSAFIDAMSQNTRLTFDDEEQWRDQLRRLLALGVAQQYSIVDAVDDLLDELGMPNK